jgi:hypothetical protein
LPVTVPTGRVKPQSTSVATPIPKHTPVQPTQIRKPPTFHRVIGNRHGLLWIRY